MSATEDTLTGRLTVMMELQDEMNRRVDADWVAHGRAWWRAIWIECAELMEHYGGWKWWKATDCDREQVLLEIVDIWHFGLSIRIERHGIEDGAAGIAEELAQAKLFESFHAGVEAVAAEALNDHDMAFEAVPYLLSEAGCDFDTLFRLYVGKNVLNIFRQDHGYRDGTYLKQWQGREDNDHLAELMGELGEDVADPRPVIRAALEARYAQALAAG